MTFTFNEMTAIYKVASAMVQADGKVEDSELAAIVNQLDAFGVTNDDLAKIIKAADSMSSTEALALISDMTLEERTYVSAYLGALLAADGDIDDSELALWRLISGLCEFPSMTVKEAKAYMAAR